MFLQLLNNATHLLLYGRIRVEKERVAAEKRNKDSTPQSLYRQISAGRGPGPDRQHMPRLDTARFRKAGDLPTTLC